MDHLIDQIVLLMDNPVALFFIMFTMAISNLFFPPIPLETATLMAGYLAGTGYGSLFVIIGSTVSGMFAGNIILYSLAKYYGEKLIFKTPLRRIITKKSYCRVKVWFKKYSWWAIFIGKAIPGMSFYAVVTSGMLRWDFKRAMFAFFASNLIYFTALTLAGRTLGSKWDRILQRLQGQNKLTLIVFGILLAGGLVCYLVWRKNKTLK